MIKVMRLDTIRCIFVFNALAKTGSQYETCDRRAFIVVLKIITEFLKRAQSDAPAATRNYD